MTTSTPTTPREAFEQLHTETDGCIVAVERPDLLAGFFTTTALTFTAILHSRVLDRGDNGESLADRIKGFGAFLDRAIMVTHPLPIGIFAIAKIGDYFEFGVGVLSNVPPSEKLIVTNDSPRDGGAIRKLWLWGLYPGHPGNCGPAFRGVIEAATIWPHTLREPKFEFVHVQIPCLWGLKPDEILGHTCSIDPRAHNGYYVAKLPVTRPT